MYFRPLKILPLLATSLLVIAACSFTSARPEKPSHMVYLIDDGTAADNFYEIGQIGIDTSGALNTAYLERDNSGAAIHAIALSPQGSHLAFIKDNPDTNSISLVIQNVNDRTSRAQITMPRGFGDISDNSLSWSPDGKLLTTAAAEELSPAVAKLVVDRDGNILRRFDNTVRGFSWGRDSSLFSYSRYQTPETIYISSVNGKRNNKVSLHLKPGETLGKVKWTNTGFAFALTRQVENGTESDLYIYQLQNEQSTFISRIDSRDNPVVYQWSASGKYLAYINGFSQGRQLVQCNEDGRGKQMLSHHLANTDQRHEEVTHLGWSPTEDAIAYRTWSSGIDQSEIGDALYSVRPGSQPVSLSAQRTQFISSGERINRFAGLEEDPANYSGLISNAWSPDGNFIAFTDHNSQPVVVHYSGAARREISTRINTALQQIVWSPDSQQIAFHPAGQAGSLPWGACNQKQQGNLCIADIATRDVSAFDLNLPSGTGIEISGIRWGG